MGLLTNLSESAMRFHAGDTRLRDFLHFIDALQVQRSEAMAAAEMARNSCENLRVQLHNEREGRNAEGFRAAMGAMGHSKALEVERQARQDLEVQVRDLQAKLMYFSECHQRQQHELYGMTHSFAEAELSMEASLRAEVQRQVKMCEAEHQKALEEMRNDCERRLHEVRKAEESTRGKLEQERSTTADLRSETRKGEMALQPWRILLAAHLPCITELVRFLSESTAELENIQMPQRARLPVLALEWPPNTPLDASMSWPPLRPDGFFGLLEGLCTGHMQPEELELTACSVDGRWIGALHGETEAPRLAALLAFQALRLDLPVVASCRVVPMKRSLLPRGILELHPERRSVASVGGTPAKQRQPPHPERADEERLRSVLRGCPLEQELLSALCYVRAAHPEALQRPLPPPLMPHAIA